MTIEHKQYKDGEMTDDNEVAVTNPFLKESFKIT